ncbi:DUF3857 domain-containing protein [Rufibacter ruber]|uniref:DUF3857 domain-containing protein n=1 Tax=Rufibacter ruber TaxID=1783499 RepID=UPI000829B0E5|nr:DUF3857 domain-containing protein [Rufibacter ruber]
MKLHEAAKSTLVLLLLLLGTSISGWCEQDPLRLGQVTDDELKMGIYPQDTAAAAVVLYDYGHSSFLFSKGTQLQFKRTVRVKILKKAGLDFANIEIPYFKKSPESKEEVLNLKGFSYNLENGKMVKVKLEENAVFDEKVDANWFVRKLAMPGVKVGSVIEYTYTIKSDFLHNLREWEFQSSIPVRWSEYRVAMVPFFEYKQVLHGFYPFHVQDSKENRVTAPITWDKEVGYAKMEERGTLSMSVVEYRWVMKDVPAFKEEPYLPNARDYLSKVEFELSKVQYPDQEPRFMAGDWEGFTKELLKEEEFGGQLTSVPALQKVAATVVAGKTEDWPGRKQ